MNKKEKKSANTAAVSPKEMLTLVAGRLKGRDLFPKKTEEAKQFLSRVKGAKA